MSRGALLIVIAVVTVALIVQEPVRQPSSNAQAPQEAAAAAPKGTRTLVGTISCATSLCHGGNELGKRRSEFTTWYSRDPHFHAFEALESLLGQQIAARLNLKQAAQDAPECLKCHVDPGYANARPNFDKRLGVGCESCHGAAQDYLADHYRADWQTANKQAKGLADTKSLYGRAGMCAKCHVGTPGNEVNHDFIAAGHPALRFEFATYFANLPPHWDVNADKKATDFETRAWAVGQLVTSASALDLLAHHADPANGQAWPELAELDCFACHHDLKAKSWRQYAKHVGKRRPGDLAWSTWYHAMTPNAVFVPKNGKVLATAVSIAAMRDLLKGNPLAKAGRGEIGAQAKDLALALRELARSEPRTAGSGLSLERLAEDRPRDRGWDDATQRYLALLVGSSRVDLQACKLEYSIVSPK